MLRLLTRLVSTRQRPVQVSPALMRDALRRKDFAAARHMLDRLRPTCDAATNHALEGELLYHEQRDLEAEQAFRDALELEPGHADAHYGLSLLLESDPAVAATHAQFAVNRNGAEARYLAQLGYLHLRLGNPQAAERALNTATKLDPSDPNAWNNLGIVMRAAGDHAAAKRCFEAALKGRPDHAQARDNLGQLQRDADAQAIVPALEQPDQIDIDALETAWANRPSDTEAATALARAYRLQDDFDSALNVLEQALERSPGNARLRGELGLTLGKQRQVRPAMAHLQAALLEHPEDVEFLLQLASCHTDVEEHTKALPLVEQALWAAPEDLRVQTKRLVCLTNLCRYQEALALASELEARGIQTDCTGPIHIFLGHDEEADRWLSKRLAVLPNDPGLRFQRAQLRLSHLDFEQGWEDYAYRGLGDARDLRVLPFPLWKGEPLNGKRIVVLAEQGLGDQVMFASCLPDLLALNPAEVIVEAVDRVAPTLQRSFPDCRIIATRQDKALHWVKDIGKVDCYVPLADLPRHFRHTLAAFPTRPSYLIADPARSAHWRQQIPHGEGVSRRPRIGLSWRGGTEGTRTFVRSIDPAWLGQLAPQLEADWISLQYGDVSQELPRAREGGLPALAHDSAAISSLDEFAALISTLDLVITVCNTTVHYAGALGVPVWVLSPRIPEWRYGLHNDVLPWYPTSRMFRQGPTDDWHETLSRVAKALVEWSASHPPKK